MLRGPIACRCSVCKADFVRTRNRGNMSVCTPCQRKQRLADWHLANPERKRELNAAWSSKNKEKDRQIKAAWQKRNPEKVAAKSAAWRAANPERTKQINLESYRRNREACIQRTLDRIGKHRTPPWANKEAIHEIYAEARRLSKDGEQFHVDHIIPLRGRNVSGLHVESNLRVMAAAENRMKSNKFTEGNP